MAIRVLLVEDNAADARLAHEALEDSKLKLVIDEARDGEAAMRFLRREGEFQSAARPDLVLLDLNLPRKGGREVLAEIRSDPKLAPIPVVVLTSSGAEEDVLKSYALHANCYITKPIDLAQLQRVVSQIKEFWFTIVKLPHEHEGHD